MSRCFPFPPPGYDKKPITYEEEILRKVRRKEKRHKKDKKDKDKREHKKKRERDKSDGKHREKNRKKKKDKDKVKEKGNDNDKGKSSTSGDKNIDGQDEGNKLQKLDQKDQHVKDGSKVLIEKKQMMQLVQSQCGEKLFTNGFPSVKQDEAKFVKELDRRIRDEEKGSASLAVARIPTPGMKNNEHMDKSLDKLAERKENIIEKRIDFRKMDGPTIKETSESLGLQAMQSVGANRLEGMTRPLEKAKIKKVAGMEEKSKSSKGREEVHKQKDNHEDENQVDKVRTKEKKERKCEHKSKGEDKFVDINKNYVLSTGNIISPPHLTEGGEISHILCDGMHNKRTEFADDVLSVLNIIPPNQNKEGVDKYNVTDGILKKRKEPNGFFIDPFSTEFEVNDDLRSQSIMPSHHQKKEDAEKGNLKNRKEFEPNGFLIDSRPNKMARLSPHVTDNGRIEPSKMTRLSPHITDNGRTEPNKMARLQVTDNGRIETNKMARSPHVTDNGRTEPNKMAQLSPRVTDNGRMERISPHVTDNGRMTRLSPHVTDNGRMTRLSPHVTDNGRMTRLSPHVTHVTDNGRMTRLSPHVTNNGRTEPNKVARLSPQVTDNGRTEPNKMIMPSTQVTNNGRTEPCLKMSPNPSIANEQVSTSNLKVNGVIGHHQPVSNSSTKFSSSTSRAKSKHVAQAPAKPPHPDTKYLKEVLSVPDMKECVDFDDQSWLFNNGKTNTSKGINGKMSEGSTVWAQAIEIQSADIYALPYVIPY